MYSRKRIDTIRKGEFLFWKRMGEKEQERLDKITFDVKEKRFKKQ